MTGYFEKRAREAAARRWRECTEFDEAEIAPIEIEAITHTAFVQLGVGGVTKLLAEKQVIFLRDVHDVYYGMISPISFEYLMQVAEALRDEAALHGGPRGRGGGVKTLDEMLRLRVRRWYELDGVEWAALPAEQKEETIERDMDALVTKLVADYYGTRSEVIS